MPHEKYMYQEKQNKTKKKTIFLVLILSFCNQRILWCEGNFLWGDTSGLCA